MSFPATATDQKNATSNPNLLNDPALAKKKKKLYHEIGLGFKVPQEAIEGNYFDKKCPFRGSVSIRGKILEGVVKSAKMKRSIVVRRDYLHYVRKYRRFEKRHKNVTAHCSPCFIVKPGDKVTLGQCRPLSKTIRFCVIAHKPNIQKIKKFIKF